MLISFAHRFLFIHIDKAAGTSIQRALQAHAEPKTDNLLRRRLVWLGALNRCGPLYRVAGFREHVTARTVQRCLPAAVYAGLFKFAFVRNPWDRLVSRYAYLQRVVEHPRHKYVQRLGDFAAYLAWEIRRGKMHQHPFVTDATGRMIVDFIGHFESVEADFATACRRLGLAAELPKVNVSAHRDYRDCYTPATRELVAREFARDIALFGYEFDGGPHRVGP